MSSNIVPDVSDTRLPSDLSNLGERVIDPNFIDENQDWKVARETVDKNINDINAWGTLITLTEQLLNKYPSPSQLVKTIISNTFAELLSRFPLFFGYWKKYISITYQINGTAESIKVLSESLDYFQNSLELWIDYLTISISNTDNNDKENIRLLFEKAIGLIGYQFLSHPFWDKYLEFENQDMVATMRILIRLIRIPLHQYAKYYQTFFTLKESFDIKQLVELEGIQIQEGLDQDHYKQHVSDHFNAVFLQTQAFVGEIWTFESQIKQSFFNLAPLPEEDFTTWDNYLNLLINKHESSPSELNKAITISTFERSLIPTALSPKFWYKYLDWYLVTFPDEFKSLDSIYKKAINLFLPLKFIEIRLNYALFLQVYNQDSDRIHDAYISIISQNKEKTEPIIDYIKFITRQNDLNYAKTCDYLEVILAKHLKRQPKGDLDLQGTRLLNLLTDKTIAVIITEIIKLNWYYIGNKSNVKKLLNFYAKFEILNDSIIFWSLNYSFHKENSDFIVLNRIIRFIKYESSLPLSVINSLLLDYSEFLATNFPDSRSIQQHYDMILELEDDIANPYSYRIRKDPQLLKNEIRQSGHPGVFIDKPDITNSIIDKPADRYKIAPLPTFKNVEKASLPIEYTEETED